MSPAPAPQGRLLPADWQARLRAGLLARPDHDFHLSAEGPGAEAATAALRMQLPAVLQAAAVLVPILLDAPTPALLLTQRAAQLRRHAGQISFPGGRVEPGELDNPAAAALRETEEEIGIPAAFVEPLGYLRDQAVMTGYRITPVVALLRPGFTLRPGAGEVEHVFELPLEVIIAADSYRARRRRVGALEITVWDLPYADQDIWGVTAALLRELRSVLLGTAVAPAGAAVRPLHH